jgi:uncharacterized membrane protein
MSAPESPQPVPPGPFPHLGDYINRGIQIHLSRWSDWVVPMLVAAGVGLAATLCCYLPLFFVAGPLSCGLWACAFRVLRGQPMDAGALWLGWPRTFAAMLSWIYLQLVLLAPMALAYLVFFVVFLTIPALAPDGFRGGGPPDGLMVGLFLGSFALLGAIVLFGMVWMLWIGTRTVFVLPLIADRQMRFTAAWEASWEETRKGFWELLLLHILAAVLSNLGAYVCYVGLIFTFPVYYTMVGLAYEQRFGGAPPSAPAERDSP